MEIFGTSVKAIDFLLILRLEFANFKVIRLVGQNLSGEVRPLKEVNPSIEASSLRYVSILR